MREESFDLYARFLVEQALSLRPGQRLDIWGEVIHRDLALRVGEAAYAIGAGPVCYRWIDPLQTAQLIRRAHPDQIAFHHLENQRWLVELAQVRGALLTLLGQTNPEALLELEQINPRNHQAFATESRLVSVDLMRRVVEQRLCPAVIAVSPTPAWARKVFPELSPSEAYEKFWELIFHFTGTALDANSPGEPRSDELLEARAAMLDQLAIREARITGGGNDLRIGFSEKARWQSGRVTTTAGQRFLYNVPGFEVFTTPDRRQTEGRLMASRAVRLRGGAMVEGLVLDFRAGRVVSFQAKNGAEAFERWLANDDGARYLGEFALLGEDSPIARCGRVFGHPLLDENAAAHVALGFGFSSALDLAPPISPSELDAAGCNRSAVHTDIAFGSPEVDVVATITCAGEVPLLRRGWWAEDFQRLEKV